MDESVLKKIGFRPAEAAKLLSDSEQTLWQWCKSDSLFPNDSGAMLI